MKILYLVRHAKSSWKHHGVRDFDRPLNKRGQRDAPEMARRLAARRVMPDFVVSSPALRALVTARTISEALGFKGEIATDERIYEASLRQLLRVVAELPDSVEAVMMFGHNPGFQALGQEIGGFEVDNLPTCGIFAIELPIDSWGQAPQTGGRLLFFDYPKRGESA